MLPIGLLERLRRRFRAGAANVPDHRNGERWWRDRHQAKCGEAKRGGHELVFIGDSITQGWEEAGRETWAEYYGDRKALNLGFSGDRTEHVLWRLTNGELEGVDPKLFVLLIGTNNSGQRQDPPDRTAEAIGLIVTTLRERRPDARILLLAVFPCGERPDHPMRRLNQAINERIRELADGVHVHWSDLSATFIGADGAVPPEIMPDGLHLEARGYARWAGAMEPEIGRLLLESGQAP